MMRSIFSEDYFRPPADAYAAFEIAPAIGLKRVFVLAIRGAGAAAGYDPVTGAFAAYAPDALHSEVANVPRRSWETLPPPSNARVPEISEGDSYWARPIAGRVVSNAEGRLCEFVGRELRPLNRIVRGPQGELLELLPAPTTARAQNAGEDVIDGELVDETAQRTPHGQGSTAPASGAAKRQMPRASGALYRNLFAEPGLPRVVEFGKFRSALAPQLAHSERLRDVHRLACHVQIYEALALQRAYEFHEAIQRVGHGNIPLQPLTEEVIAILDLSQFLARHPRPPQDAPREPGYVLPYECFYSFRVNSDPTAIATAQTRTAAPTPRSVTPDVNGAASAPPDASPAVATSLRRDIPERFQNPWEFQFGRDEVMYDMNVGNATTGSVRTLLHKVGRWLGERGEFRKWRALLGAKNLEEQLWGVRPPRGSFSDPVVREWVRQTLEGAGYDPRVMLHEWEIFWRRKGV